MDNHQGILFIKEFIDEDKNRYFMSVAKNYDGEWICASHTRRKFNNIKNEIQRSKVIYNQGFQRSEVAGASDMLESGGEVSKPSDLQIKYTANQDFGKNPQSIISQNEASLEYSNKSHFRNLSLEEKLAHLEAKQQEILNLPRASEISIQEEEDTKHNNKQDEARHNKRIKK